MKKMKKALLGTALAGTLVIGAGAGTYSWFNASYTQGGEITNHTLEINDSTEAYGVSLDFGGEMLAPSRTVSDSFTFKNTGSMDQVLRATLDLALYDGATNIGTPDKSKYSIKATAKLNGNQIASATGNAQAIDNWFHTNEWFPNANGMGVLKPEDVVTIDLEVTLLNDAGNEYQGKTLKGGVKVEARQTDAGAQF